MRKCHRILAACAIASTLAILPPAASAQTDQPRDQVTTRSDDGFDMGWLGLLGLAGLLGLRRRDDDTQHVSAARR